MIGLAVSQMEASSRPPRRFGSPLASINVGRVELLARGRWHRPPPTSRGTRVVAVGSVGGRVGQSTVTAHLAIATANLGAQVIAVDLDGQAPALSRLLGVEPAVVGWRALLDREIQALEPALTRTSARNLHLLSAGAPREGARPEAPFRLDAAHRRLLIQQLRAQEVDIIILDLGPQSPDDLADFFALSELGLAVTTRERQALATWLAVLAQIAPSPVNAGADARPGPRFRARLVGNQARGPEDFEAFHAFSRLVHAELSLQIPVIGCVRTQERLSATDGPPTTPARPGTFDGNAHTFLRMGELLLHEDCAPRAGAPPAREPAAAPQPPRPPASISVEPREIAEAELRLSNNLEKHRRKKARIDVDWAATLEVDGRRVAVRVVDVSLSGAALELVSTVAPGAEGILTLDQLPGQPDIPVMVKSLRPEIGRAGVAFMGAEAMRRALVATAEEQRSPISAVVIEDDFEEEEPTQPLRAPSRLA